MEASEGSDSTSEDGPEQVAPEAETGRGRLRFTSLFVTLNLQRSASTVGGIGVFEQYLNDVLFTRQHLPALLGLRDSQLSEVHILEPVIEISPGRQLLHAHWMMNITHRSKILLAGIQKRWQRYISFTLPFANNGVYVQIQVRCIRLYAYLTPPLATGRTHRKLQPEKPILAITVNGVRIL
jgi:hypothetical protein